MALYVEKSLEAVAAIYAVLKAGGVYVPLDANAPPARIAYIARDCDVRCVVADKERATMWREDVERRAPGAVVVELRAADEEPDDRPTHVDEQPSPAPGPPTTGHDLAYLLYTSGSTGEPKGVTLSHLNALAFVEWAAARFELTPQDRLSSHAPLHFDLSIFDLFAAARAGATVVLVPATASVFPVELARFIEEREISIWYSVPSVLSALALRGGLRGGEFPRLRTVLFAGEVFPTGHLRRLMKLVPHARFFNLYGPTENNVCTYYEVPPPSDHEEGPVPIGKPITDVEVLVVTEDGAVAPPGEVGELYVRGPTVMQGYWRDPARTAKALVPDPRRDHRDGHFYRTGDLVQEGEDGNYRFLGRRDNQVKSRGYRIELGEVESALFAHPSVADCAVIAIPDDVTTNRLKAFVVLREEVGRGDLVSFCAERIPRYMIPESLEFRESLPRTSTGKTDRQRLQVESRSS